MTTCYNDTGKIHGMRLICRGIESEFADMPYLVLRRIRRIRSHEQVARMRIAVHEAVQENHIGQGTHGRVANVCDREAHFRNLVLLGNAAPVNKLHAQHALGCQWPHNARNVNRRIAGEIARTLLGIPRLVFEIELFAQIALDFFVHPLVIKDRGRSKAGKLVRDTRQEKRSAELAPIKIRT